MLRLLPIPDDVVQMPGSHVGIPVIPIIFGSAPEQLLYLNRCQVIVANGLFREASDPYVNFHVIL